MRQGYYYHQQIELLCAGDSDAGYKQISTSVYVCLNLHVHVCCWKHGMHDCYVNMVCLG
jgi:hypothetical protein